MHILDLFTLALAASNQISFQLVSESASDDKRPVVLWHGMGDYYNSSSMSKVIDIISEVHPNIPIHSIWLDKENDRDQQLGLLGNLTEQIADVCLQLHNNSLLEFDAIGFSQGGLFLRSLLESCEGIKINNLITFGSPHNGVFDLPLCNNGDWICKRRNELLKKQVYNPSIQHKLIQAQYFRDVFHYDEYLEKSAFIADINNDKIKKQSYAENMINNLIGNFVMIMFSQDRTLVPKESAWFYDYDPLTEESLSFTETESFKLNLIGLQDLYKQNKIIFKQIDDEHMRIDTEFLTQIIKEFTGEEQSANFDIRPQEV